jgi:hypothetical protein
MIRGACFGTSEQVFPTSFLLPPLRVFFSSLPNLFVITILALITLETTFLLPAKQTSWSPHQHSARLRIHPLAHVTFFRLFSAFLTIPVAFVSPWATLPILVISELCSRHLFFASVQAPKMPGGLN